MESNFANKALTTFSFLCFLGHTQNSSIATVADLVFFNLNFYTFLCNAEKNSVN